MLSTRHEHYSKPGLYAAMGFIIFRSPEAILRHQIGFNHTIVIRQYLYMCPHKSET